MSNKGSRYGHWDSGGDGKIFDRFYQVDNSTTRMGEGTGIGLALTKELIRLMHGEISVSSKKAAGSTFVVTIPITTGSPVAEAFAPRHSFAGDKGAAPCPCF